MHRCRLMGHPAQVLLKSLCSSFRLEWKAQVVSSSLGMLLHCESQPRTRRTRKRPAEASGFEATSTTSEPRPPPSGTAYGLQMPYRLESIKSQDYYCRACKAAALSSTRLTNLLLQAIKTTPRHAASLSPRLRTSRQSLVSKARACDAW